MCERKRISFEERALVAFSKSWYFGDSEKVYVVCQLVNLCHDVIHMNWLVDSKRHLYRSKHFQTQAITWLSTLLIVRVHIRSLRFDKPIHVDHTMTQIDQLTDNIHLLTITKVSTFRQCN